jgi:hypothetical protein
MRATLFNRSRGVALAATIAQRDVWPRLDAQQAQRCVQIVTEVDATFERDQVVSGVTITACVVSSAAATTPRDESKRPGSVAAHEPAQAAVSASIRTSPTTPDSTAWGPAKGVTWTKWRSSPAFRGRHIGPRKMDHHFLDTYWAELFPAS